MAHDLTGTKVRLHQALHGYSEGHRLLGCSTVLKPRDQKTMLVMSDVSGPNASIARDGYITGYPLSESGVYALARTWAATEMTRPGCVWTHTLLLDFAELAALPQMMFLQRAFRRPINNPADWNLDKPIYIEDTGEISVSGFDRGYLERLLWALYAEPKNRIVAPNLASSEIVALILWGQQWPRLRRSFRFCTLAFDDRSIDGSPFDLQFIPARERSVRSRFSGVVDAEKVRPLKANWMDAALLDLLGEKQTSLRKFLREVGGDLAGGREAFAPLCELYHLMPQFGDRQASVDEALVLVEELFESAQANSLRAIFVSAIAKHPAAMGGRALSFVIDHLDLLDADSLRNASAPIGRAIWAQSPERLVELLNGMQPARMIAENGLASLPTRVLIQGLERAPSSIPTVLSIRPEIAAQADLWSIAAPWTEAGLRIVAAKTSQPTDILSAMLAARRDDLAQSAVRVFGDAAVLNFVCDWASLVGVEAQRHKLNSWLAASTLDADTVASVLSNRPSFQLSLLSLIARQTYSDFVPNLLGEDPWWSCVRQAKEEIDDTASQYLSAYLLARALGSRSRNQADLIAYAFDNVYIPASQSRLSSEAWRILEPRLPRSWFFDWDYCQKLRDGLAEAFVDRELPPEIFGRVTGDDKVFEQLSRVIARSGRGRRYLRKVIASLSTISGRSRREAIINDVI